MHTSHYVPSFDTIAYIQPQILSGVAKFLSFTRFSGSTDFADLVSPQMNNQKDYTYGMVFLVTIMVTILVLWASVLIVLKYHGDVSGCAAGNPFQTSSNSSSSTQNETFDTNSLDGSRHDAEEGVPLESSVQQSKNYKKAPIKAAKRRQRRTRIVFITFGVVLLVCTALLLVFSFSSFQRTMESSDEIMTTSQDIVDQIKATVVTVESAIEYANETLSRTALDIRSVCPNFLTEEDVGVDLVNLTIIMRREFQTLDEVGAVNMTEINRTLSTVQNGLNRLRDTVDTAEQKSWMFPLVLLIVFVIGTIMLVGAMLAWTNKSSSSFERKMAYGILPIAILLAAVCWLVALGCAIASLITSGKQRQYELNHAIFGFLISHISIP
jgi:heme/copper-type cytochrome/quinol oxidase subunit 2